MERCVMLIVCLICAAMAQVVVSAITWLVDKKADTSRTGWLQGSIFRCQRRHGLDTRTTRRFIDEPLASSAPVE